MAKDTQQCFEIIEAPNSLEHFYLNGNKLTMIGAGVLKSPGHPAGNQQYYNQHPFLRLIYRLRTLHLFFKRLDGVSVYMGEYALQSFKKRVSFEGFSYFEYIFFRKTRNFNKQYILGPRETLNSWQYGVKP